MRSVYYMSMLLLALGAAWSSCEKDDGPKALRNDMIKKTDGPNLVGNEIEFAYVMAVPGSKLDAAYAEASIAGAAGTGFDPNSYHTGSTGQDIGVPVATDCTTEGGRSQAVFIDTLAATLRYRYVVPEEARGRSVSIVFSCKAKNGETVSYRVPDQKIARMYMRKGIRVTSDDRCYISIRNMAAYTLEEVRSQGLAGEIDLIYHYRKVAGIDYGHVLLSPGTEAEYLEGAVVPEGATHVSKVEKQVSTFDRHLVIDAKNEVSAGGYSFIDDIDFETYNPGPALSFVLNMAKCESVWVVGADGKHRAFLQVNSVTNGGMTISMKSYAM